MTYQLAQLLMAHGVRHAILSPGSRNAPLLQALADQEGLETHVVVDERSAAFVALGMSVQSGHPVALCCTSGTALLNYAPAVAEAYYRGAPLIVISADRPAEWIDQDDSQTLRQDNALSNWVKRQWTLDANSDKTADGRWMANRCINDALLTALEPRRGPVHLNIRLSQPNQEPTAETAEPRVIRMMQGTTLLRPKEGLELSRRMARSKVMVVAGFMAPNDKLSSLMSRLTDMPNVVVLTENVSNLHGLGFIGRIDTVLLQAGDKPELKPELVITMGGALISRHIKEYLRSLPPTTEHWAVGHSHTTVDCFRRLTLRIDMEPVQWLRSLRRDYETENKQTHNLGFSRLWHETAQKAIRRHDIYVSSAPWSNLVAMRHIIASVPKNWDVQLSNGTAIRYAQLMDCSHLHRVDCNRGVSGIDGSTSTAIGASVTYSRRTLLITGDMSFQYDIGALGCNLLTPKLTIIVLCNGGGGIFRFVAATRDLPGRESLLGMRPMNLPAAKLGHAYGMVVEEANNETELKNVLFRLRQKGLPPKLILVHTDPETSAKVLKGYFTV